MKSPYVGRKEPYTETGVRRCKCFRCGDKASHQWNVCANDGRYLPICDKCDVLLNSIVLAFMKHPNAEVLVAQYASERLGDRGP